MIGVYKITSPTNKIYIGQSINIEQRWKRYNKLYCKSQTKLYYSLKKYGPENHIFEIIEECKESNLLERETYWKNHYKVLEIPSLCCRIDGKGGKNSKTTNELISKSNKGISTRKEKLKFEYINI
jgi:group I intron endonuclease